MAASHTVYNLAQSRNSGTKTVSLLTPRHGVVTLFGYGISVCVGRGHLICKDGIGSERREARLPRVGHGLRRLVVIGSDGMVSLAALRWLADQDAAFVMLERDGSVLATTGPVRPSDARLRRAQSLAYQSGIAIRIARELISRKLQGQEQVVRSKLRDMLTADTIARAHSGAKTAETISSIRQLEAQAAYAYWSAWRNIPIDFPKNDLRRVPEHWRSFGSRHSPLTGSPRLTYAYGRIKHGHTSETEWEKTYRIATLRYFDAYFALVLPESEVSVQEITSFVAASDNQAKMEETLVEWTRQGKLTNAIESVRYRLAEAPQNNLRNVFAALLTAGEMASEKGVIFAGQIPEYWNVRWAIFDVLEAIPTESRVSIVKETFSNSASLKTLINVAALIEEEKKTNAQRHAEFQDQDLDEIKAIVVSRIRESAKPSTALLANPALPVILKVWQEWGGSAEEVNTFVAQAIKTDSDFVSFIDNFIYQTHSSSGRVIVTKNRLRMKALSQWINPNDALTRLDQVREESVSVEKREVIKVARSELLRFKSKGLTPEQFDSDPFFD